VSVNISSFDITGTLEVKSFDVQIIRSDDLIYSGKNNGGKLNGESLDAFKILKANDTLIFENIYAYYPGESKPRRTNNIKINLK